jgi:tetratricopeptide (TPR) repeat protein
MLSNRQIALIYLFLTLVAFAAFRQVTSCNFVNFDDHYYVTENSHILNGITVKAVEWAFTTARAANWHPLTWLSHALDVQLFGLNPCGHHLTNLLFHIANTLLLFFVLCRMTKAPWKSAFVAALFAIHPLHVESVAWVAERKDVLSTFFFMLTVAAHVGYVEHRMVNENSPRTDTAAPLRRRNEEVGRRKAKGSISSSFFSVPFFDLRYLAVVLFFALGLMAKPMLVTLPFILLLLDYWPLQRLGQQQSLREFPVEAKVSAKKMGRRSGAASTSVTAQVGKPAESIYKWKFFRPLLWEKIPLFALAASSSAITFIVQRKGGAVISFGEIPPGVRIGNALVSYFIYVEKTCLPHNLAVFYPYHEGWAPWQICAALLFLAAVSLAVIWAAREVRYPLVGWFWYLGMLFPVIGIVQVGDQAMADRYSYIPVVGLFIAAAWTIPDLLKKYRYRGQVLFVLSVLVISYFFALTRAQVGYWRNSFTLYDHALEVTRDNCIIHYNRGAAFLGAGDQKRAIEDYDGALAICPGYEKAYADRGVAYAALGDHERAISDFSAAIGICPGNAPAYYDRGNSYIAAGNPDKAISDYDRAVEIDPEYEMAYINRGIAYGELGNPVRALENFNRAIEINPRSGLAYNNRSLTYRSLGRWNLANEDLRKAAEFGGEDAKDHSTGQGMSR